MGGGGGKDIATSVRVGISKAKKTTRSIQHKRVGRNCKEKWHFVEDLLLDLCEKETAVLGRR